MGWAVYQHYWLLAFARHRMRVHACVCVNESEHVCVCVSLSLCLAYKVIIPVDLSLNINSVCVCVCMRLLVCFICWERSRGLLVYMAPLSPQNNGKYWEAALSLSLRAFIPFSKLHLSRDDSIGLQSIKYDTAIFQNITYFFRCSRPISIS